MSPRAKLWRVRAVLLVWTAGMAVCLGVLVWIVWQSTPTLAVRVDARGEVHLYLTDAGTVVPSHP